MGLDTILEPFRGSRNTWFSTGTNGHIVPHSKLLVDSSREPQNCDIVVVQRGKQFTARFFKCSDHKRWLVSANRKYADILFDDASGTAIYVVVKVITDTALLRDYMI